MPPTWMEMMLFLPPKYVLSAIVNMILVFNILRPQPEPLFRSPDASAPTCLVPFAPSRIVLSPALLT